ncbi:MAG: imidazole glycerol phosphate synthase subunit HisF [Acidimicrobiaceae bacterium]|nr:imidazole glycerol phosphate synthase subunit HisF [Acidimicrobiaceae bacterium]
MFVEPRVIPVLLLENRQLVKTRVFEDPVYVGDPVNVLSIFNEFVVDEIVLLDIVAARTRTPSSFPLLQKYAEECFIPLAYGGGLTELDQFSELYHAGYEKAVVNTLLSEDPSVVEAAASRFGSQAVVASIDVRRGGGGLEVVVRGNREVVSDSPGDWARRAVDLGVGEVLVTAVDREGTGAGFDLELISEVAEAVDVPVIGHGGGGRRAELGDPVLKAGASAVAAGTLFVFQGPDRGVLINYPPRRQIEKILMLRDGVWAEA